MANRTTGNRPEPLPLRWALIFFGAGVVALAVLTLGGAPLAALLAAGGAVLGLHQILS